MFTLVRSMTLRRLLLEQIPTLALSFLIAEIFYKFHSFTLECAAFLATWYVLDGLVQLVRGRLRGRKPALQTEVNRR